MFNVKHIISLIVVFFLSTYNNLTFGQSKKEQLSDLHQQTDSLFKVVDSIKRKYQELYRQIGKEKEDLNVLLKTNKERIDENERELNNLQNRIRAIKDSFSQQLDTLRNLIRTANPFRPPVEIEKILQIFFKNINKKNILCLIKNKSQELSEFLKPDIPVINYWNPGIYCYFKEINEEVDLECNDQSDKYSFLTDFESNLPMFYNIQPASIEPCTTSSTDGIYIYPFENFPISIKPSPKDDIKEYYTLPTKYSESLKYVAEIWQDGSQGTSFYFIQYEEKWLLVAIYGCDCSA
jgi:hypothetical protein